jgi:hypothetical protein
MAFFIVERETADGRLRLPVSGTFATREEALASLSAAVASGDATVTGGQVYVVDLDSAVPVLVMPAAPAPTPDDEEEAELVPEAGAETVDAGAGASLADALKRATSSLEESGIRAPESIGAHEDGSDNTEDVGAAEEAIEETGDDAEEVDESQVAAQAFIAPELRDLPAASVVAEPMSSIPEAEAAPIVEASGEDEAAAVEEPAGAPTEWPWANVEDFSPEGEDARDFEAETATDEPDTLIASAPPMGEDAYLPRPVILGDYGDGAAEDAPVIPEESAPDEDESEDERAVAEPGYEASGSLDMSAYTCSDCIYSNTCPKVGEVTPAECGTFQWRSS